jgi:hypothetical protein
MGRGGKLKRSCYDTYVLLFLSLFKDTSSVTQVNGRISLTNICETLFGKDVGTRSHSLFNPLRPETHLNNTKTFNSYLIRTYCISITGPVS